VVLSAAAIEEEIAKGYRALGPLITDCVEAASIDIYLGSELLVFKRWCYPSDVDVEQSIDNLTHPVTIEEDKPFF
jgi:deoxycytidine triphosphate deaminase